MLTYDNLKIKKKNELIEIILKENSPKASSVTDAVKTLYSVKINHSQENFIVLCLNRANQVVKKKVLFKGGMASCSIDPKIIFKELLSVSKCTNFVIAHNHPSGNLIPSKKDLEITQKIKKGAKLLDLNLLDHIVFDESSYYSFLEENIL